MATKKTATTDETEAQPTAPLKYSGEVLQPLPGFMEYIVIALEGGERHPMIDAWIEKYRMLYPNPKQSPKTE